MGRYFQYEAAARAAGLSDVAFAALRHRIEALYPSRMLREMHLLEVCRQIGAGDLTVAEALAPRRDAPPPSPSEMRMGG